MGYDKYSTDFTAVYNFGNADSSASFSVPRPTFLLLDPDNGVKRDLTSSAYYINGRLRIVVVVKSHMRLVAPACINFFRTSESKY